jgi:hypothetical protein
MKTNHDPIPPFKPEDLPSWFVDGTFFEGGTSKTQT